jgi:hypothetical protein
MGEAEAPRCNLCGAPAYAKVAGEAPVLEEDGPFGATFGHPPTNWLCEGHYNAVLYHPRYAESHGIERAPWPTAVRAKQDAEDEAQPGDCPECGGDGDDGECAECAGTGDVVAGLRERLFSAEVDAKHGQRVDERWWKAVHADEPEVIARIMERWEYMRQHGDEMPPEPPATPHHASCYRDPGHHQCAIRRVEEMEAQQPVAERVAFWLWAGRHVDTDTPGRAVLALLRQEWDAKPQFPRDCWTVLAHNLMAAEAPLVAQRATPQPSEEA